MQASCKQSGNKANSKFELVGAMGLLISINEVRVRPEASFLKVSLFYHLP